MLAEFERFSVVPLIVGHYRALITPGRRRPSVWVAIVLVVFPLGLGVAAFFGQFRLSATAIAPLLTAAGLLVGVLLSSFVLLTNLRIKISESDKWSYQARTIRLVAHSAASALYLTFVSLLLIGALLVGAALVGRLPGQAVLAGTAVVIALIAHIGLNFLTVLRRLYGVYVSLFKADFDPVLELVPGPQIAQSGKRTGTEG